MKKRDEVRQEFAKAAQAVRKLPAWMQELEQQEKQVRESKSAKAMKVSTPRPAGKKTAI